jgi:hypothetical protein
LYRRRAWLVPAGFRVYDEPQAEKALNRLLALYSKALACAVRVPHCSERARPAAGPFAASRRR